MGESGLTSINEMQDILHATREGIGISLTAQERQRKIHTIN